MDRFVVLHVQKFKGVDVRGLEIHCSRESKNSSNKDIDWSKTEQNVNLLENGTPMRARVRELVESRANPNGTALRKDAVCVCSVMVSASPDFLRGMPRGEVLRYFQTACDWLCEKFGMTNAVGCYVHFDEATPHAHFLFVPLTDDNRLSAKDVVNRNSLRQLQEALPQHLRSCGFNVERGLAGSPASHVDARDWKREQLIKEIALEGLLSVTNIPVEEQKSFFGKSTGNVIVKRDDLNRLIEVAKGTVDNRLIVRRQYAEELREIRNSKSLISGQVQKLEEIQKKQKKEADRLTKEASEIKDEKKRLEKYRKALESQDKDLELQRLIADAKEDAKRIAKREAELVAREDKLYKAEDEAERRVKEAAKRAIKEELEKAGTLKRYEAMLLQTMKEEQPDLYNKLIQNEKIKAFEKANREAVRRTDRDNNRYVERELKKE